MADESTRDRILRICQQWADAGAGDEHLWEDFPECPSGLDAFTANDIIAAFQTQEPQSSQDEKNGGKQ